MTELIGVGSTSCVIEKPIGCSTTISIGNEKVMGIEDADKKNIISKIVPEKVAIEEEKELINIEKYDPEHIFTLNYIGKCVPSINTKKLIKKLKIFEKQKSTKLYQLLLEYGGISIDDSAFLLSVYGFKGIPSTKKLYPIIITEVMRMLYAVYRLRINNISHYDLHGGNIIVNRDTLRFSIIDFGMLVEDKNIWEQIKKHNFNQHDFSHYPPELLLLIWITKTIPRVLPTLFGVLPGGFISLIEEGSRRDNSGELRRELPKMGVLGELDRFLLPEYFPQPRRNNLYSIRCSGVLGLLQILERLERNNKNITKQEKLEYIISLSVYTMDSYAISSLLIKFTSLFLLGRPNLGKITYIKEILKILEKMSDNNITKRMDINEGILEVIKIYKNNRDRFKKQIGEKQSGKDRIGRKIEGEMGEMGEMVEKVSIDRRKDVKLSSLIANLRELNVF
jgi:hypothetical protein